MAFYWVVPIALLLYLSPTSLGCNSVSNPRTKDAAMDAVLSGFRLEDFPSLKKEYCHRNDVVDCLICRMPPPANSTKKNFFFAFDHQPSPPESDQSKAANLKREYLKNITDAFEQLMSIFNS